MKKIKPLFIVIVLGYFFMPLNIQSQNIFPNTGNVGIGTTNPVRKLHLHDSSEAFFLMSGASPGILFSNIHGTSTNYGVAAIGLATTNFGNYIASATYGDFSIRGGAGRDLLFGTLPSSSSFNGIERMRITNNGRIGIGIATPESKLHVNGTIKNSSFDFRNGSGDLRMRRFGAGDVNWKRALVPTYDTSTNKSTLVMNFVGDFEDGVRIAGSKLHVDGNLGLGTANPETKIHVVSGSDTSLSGGGFITTGNLTGYNISMDNNEIQARNNGNYAPLHLQTQGGDLVIHQNSGSAEKRVIVKADGEVGIGTLDTSGYKLAVKGNILTEELKIRTYANWPDYVFEDTYNLKSLSILENEINALGHLPNMPSAKEVKEDGFNVGKINAKLLEKVEELTLYTINQQKEIEELKSLVNKLLDK